MAKTISIPGVGAFKAYLLYSPYADENYTED